jgi:hypothetical protein
MRTARQILLSPLIAVLGYGADGQPDVSPSASSAKLPPCANAGPAVSIPSEFPDTFPLPPGTIITSSSSSETGGFRLEGFIPMDLKSAVAYFVKALRSAGYRLGDGEEEQGEAESRFSGNGCGGRFKLRSLRDCPGVVTLKIILFKPSPAQTPAGSARATVFGNHAENLT